MRIMPASAAQFISNRQSKIQQAFIGTACAGFIAAGAGWGAQYFVTGPEYDRNNPAHATHAEAAIAKCAPESIPHDNIIAAYTNAVRTGENPVIHLDQTVFNPCFKKNVQSALALEANPWTVQLQGWSGAVFVVSIALAIGFSSETGRRKADASAANPSPA